MQKRGLFISILLFLGITFINFVSAQFYGGSSVSDILYFANPSTIIPGALFIIIFYFSNLSISRITRGRGGAGGTIAALAISVLAVYGINRMGFDFDGFFFNLGFSESLLYTIIPLVLLLGLIYFIWVFKISKTFLVLGTLLIIVSFTDLIYEKGIVLIIGIVLMIIGFYFSGDKKLKKLKKRYIDTYGKKLGKKLWKERKK